MNSAERAAIIDKVVQLVLAKHVDPFDLRRDYNPWKASIDAARRDLTERSDEYLEQELSRLLGSLGTSHMGFLRPSNPGMGAIFSLNASIGSIEEAGGARWMIQHVLDDGPAARAGLKAGEIIVEVNGAAVTPPSPALFRLGETQELVVESWKTRERRRVSIELPKAAKQNGRPPMVMPKLVSSVMLDGTVGYIRGTYFQGVIGIDFIRAFSSATRQLQDSGAKTFVLDFRANPGGGLASLRVMSWLTPGRKPVGYSLTRKMIAAGRAKESLPCIDQLPLSLWQRASMLVKYRVWNRDRSVALATEGLGGHVLQGRSVLLFDENSRSAAEMVAAFVAEHGLALLVGVKTPGEVLGATNFKLPHGYRLRMPIATWCTWNGETIEGKGVAPNIAVKLTPDALAENVDSQLAKAHDLARSL